MLTLFKAYNLKQNSILVHMNVTSFGTHSCFNLTKLPLCKANEDMLHTLQNKWSWLCNYKWSLLCSYFQGKEEMWWHDQELEEMRWHHLYGSKTFKINKILIKESSICYYISILAIFSKQKLSYLNIWKGKKTSVWLYGQVPK